jgi:hypothetical protein
MDITEVTVVHHAALVLAALWAAASAGWAHPALFLVALLYIFAVSAHAPPTAHPPARVSLSLALDRLLRRVDCFLPRTRRISQLCRQFADYYIWELDFRAASLKLYFCGFLFLLVLNSSALLCACMV